MSPNELQLVDELIPQPLAPRYGGARASALEAMTMLEKYRVVAMAMATRAIAMHWDSGLIASQADASLVPPRASGESIGTFPYEQEVLALIGVSHGRAGDRWAEAERGVLQALQDLTEVEQELGGKLLPLVEIASDFGLSSMEKLILVLVAAPQLWGEIQPLYRIATTDQSRIVDEALLSRLFGPQVNPHLIAQSLLPGAPLLSSGLLYIEGNPTPPFALLRVSPLALARLRGDTLEHDPAKPAAKEPAALRLSQLVIDPAAVASVREWATRDPAHTRLVLRGRKASGRTTLARALAFAAHRRLAVIELPLLGRGELNLLAGLEQALLRCRVAGWVPCVTGFDALTNADRELSERLARALDDYDGPLIVRIGLDEQPLLTAGYRMIDLAPLSALRRQQMWHDELARHGLPTERHEQFAARWRVGPGTICQVVAGVASTPPADRDVAALVDQAVTQHLQNRLGDVAERVRALPHLSDIVLPSDITDSLKEFLARNRFGQKVYEQWGMARIATTGRGITALFEGAPGTGKTMVAGALARELGLDLYRVDLSRILSKWMGETERNLANVFSAAEDGHAIILFDEADSLFTKRTEVKSSNDRHANLEVNYLLQRLDTFVGIAILTTNFGSSIDAAFKRRLSFRLTFPVPDEEIREQLWRKHLPPQMPVGEVDFAELAHKYHLAGGAVRNCVVRAAFLAAAEDAVLDQTYLLRAIRLEYRSVGKLSEGGPLE